MLSVNLFGVTMVVATSSAQQEAKSLTLFDQRGTTGSL